jgi:cell division protein FtsL
LILSAFGKTMAQNGHSVSNNASKRFRRLGPMTLRGALGLLVAILVMGLIGWMYLSQASAMAETERHIAKLRQRKQDLQQQNDQLAYDIARLASVGRLERRARELGYVPVGALPDRGRLPGPRQRPAR